MSIKLSNYFFLLAVVCLTLSFSVKAQNSSVCGKGYTYEYVSYLVYESELEMQYDSVKDRYEYVPVSKWKMKWRWECVPIPPKANSTTSKDKKTNSSNSNVVRDAEVKPSLGLRPPYAGQYSGKWITTYSDAGEQKGEWTLSVDADGKITGKEVNTTFDATADISGFVSEDGHIELSLQYGGIYKDTPPALMKGSVTNVENRRLRGTLKQYRGEKVTFVIEIDLAPSEKLNKK